MKKWNILNKSQISPDEFHSRGIPNGNGHREKNIKEQNLLNILLENRGIKTKAEKKEFLNPNLSKLNYKLVGINSGNLQKAIKRIKAAIKKEEHIIVFGDYDVDGICGAAIIWETLSEMRAKALPFIPSRFEEGYGLSVKGIENVITKDPQIKLIITVDNGIVANDAVDYAKSKGIDVVITDHHVPGKILPKAFAIVHSTAVCGAAVGYVLSQEISKSQFPISKKIQNTKYQIPDTHLELVVLATIADLVPLTYANRTLVKFGLEKLRITKRPGLLALFRNAVIDPRKIGVYEIGHMIAPRINAMGRLSSAMDSLRLICTTNIKRATDLAAILSSTNLQRQEITGEVLVHAKNKAKEKALKNLIFIADKSYQQGVIGLVAGRLVEEFYLPSIVISKGEKLSKASARSVKGFNIIEFLRQASDLMVDLGGHPMAAGFTVETQNLDLLEKKLYKLAAKLINKDHLERVLNIDLELPEDLISTKTFSLIQNLSPFGMANPEPLFVTEDLRVIEIRPMGNDGKHLKLKLRSINAIDFEALAFGMAQDNKIKIGDIVSVAYTLDINKWNGEEKLQLKIKDISNN